MLWTSWTTRLGYRPTLERLEERWTPATLPSGFSESVIASGLTAPTAMDFAPDGRIFITEQGGTLRIVKNGALLPTPFLTLQVSSAGERGLLGVAFDPNFTTNHFVYVYYTTASIPIHNRISRFTANGDVAVPGSEVVLMDLETLNATNHNGGGIHFGPDGRLYIGVGENAVSTNSQTLGNRLGKLLRINADGSIPTDNPFFTQAVGDNRAIWALGLRNPYTFAFQPGTGRLFINDVGQVLWEEIDEGVAGGNYGWPIYEGPSNPPDPRFIDPVFAYPHNGASAAIVGGAFYNPTTVLFPTEDVGDYFFADFVQGFIKQLDVTTRAVSDFASGIANPVDLKVNADGSLYYLASGSGELVRVQHPPPSPPPPPPSPTPPGASSVGVFDPATGNWYIRNNNSSGAPDITPFAYGAAGWVPLAGDWDGNASVTLGVFDPNTAIWYLRNSNSAGAPDFTPFAYGAPGWIPIVGDWDGDGITTIGVFDPSTATWYLRNSNSPGAPSITPFRYGGAGWLPAVGDWDGDRTTTIGVVDPATETWYLKNSNSAGAPDITPFAYGAPGWVPVAGDWDADGRESVGVFDPTSATWYLRNTNSGGAPDITPFAYGGANWKPVPAPWGRSVGVQPAARELWLDALAAATLL